MRTLATWILDDTVSADRAAEVLAGFVRREAVVVDDAVAVRWAADAPWPGVRRLPAPPGADPAGDLFWGALVALLLLPQLGTATRPEGALTGLGIPDALIAEAGDALAPGTSALLVLTEGTAVGRLHDALAVHRPRLLYANLPPAHDEALRAIFAASARYRRGER